MRTPRGAWLAVCLLVACGGGDDFEECGPTTPCRTQGGVPGTCRLSPASPKMWCTYDDSSCTDTGQRWGVLAGDMLAGACVGPNGLIDASLEGADAAREFDAAAGADAMPDAEAPLVPPVSNGQAAELVLGQPDFTSSSVNAGGESLSSLNTPHGVASDGVRLWVADSFNSRVLQWSTLPLVNKAGANVVIGQTTTNSHTLGVAQTLLGRPWHVAIAGGKIFAVDLYNSRVMIWNALPTMSGTPADVVVGQTTFTAASLGKGAAQLYGPKGVWSDGTRLIVADSENHRVLLWNAIPTTNGVAADVVLGWPAFGMGAGDPVGAASATTLNRPEAIFVDGGRLFVADTQNHRVLIWNTLPTTSGTPADLVVGQSGMDSGLANAGAAGPNEYGLRLPSSMITAFGSLFVADTGNNRVLVYTPVPSASAPAAAAVLGQNDFTSTGAPMPSQTTLVSPDGLAVVGIKLFVADASWNRVVRFNLMP